MSRLRSVGVILLLFVNAASSDDSIQSARMHPVGQAAPLDEQERTTDTNLDELVIDIHYQGGQRCVIHSLNRMIERNLTLPYRQQTLYGTTQCQSDN